MSVFFKLFQLYLLASACLILIILLVLERLFLKTLTIFCWAISSPIPFSANTKVFLNDQNFCFACKNERCFAVGLCGSPSASGSASASASANHLRHLKSIFLNFCFIFLYGFSPYHWWLAFFSRLSRLPQIFFWVFLEEIIETDEAEVN